MGRSLNQCSILLLLATVSSMLFPFTEAASGLPFEVKLIGQRRKCYSEDLQADALIVAEFFPLSEGNFSARIFGKNTQGHPFFQETSYLPMKTAFTVPYDMTLSFCVYKTHVPPSQVAKAAIRLTWGAAVRDTSHLAKKEQLDPIVQDIRQIEAFVSEYHTKLLHQRAFDSKLHLLTEATNRRVLILGAFNVALAILLNLGFTVYFRWFFKTRKTI